MSYDWNQPAKREDFAPKMAPGEHLASVARIMVAQKKSGESYRNKTSGNRQILVIFKNSSNEEAMDSYEVEGRAPVGATPEQEEKATYGATWKIRRHLRAVDALEEAGDAGLAPGDLLSQVTAERWLRRGNVKLVINEKGYIQDLVGENETPGAEDNADIGF